ncbi:DEAD/DEAH box helicase [Thermofilum pendens]|uniref:DEAD/DEAH box helicase domain protein n=1 Tax=Thermofilum pendens (strain DSM 2475 / Hrk 5) TaxID=368408 RepID=A1RX10_THEPD|nr:DEAD/DEAH box helicase [Thermofilum pendens]ABL77740.1 DEAD/DEAH box helicase domain protein [Thermofilum pendens Hrk 5]
MLNSEEILQKLGYRYYAFREPPSEPETADVSFADILGVEKASGRLAALLGRKLYKHQVEAFKALSEGKNVVLKAGTGSGKTEAWFLYVVKSKKRALAVYPTLALASDQLARLKDYSQSLGVRVSQIDATSKSEMFEKGLKSSGIRSALSESDIVVTNPAFLLMDLKRLATKPSTCTLFSFFQQLDLLVLDEIDFYSPRELALLVSIMKILSELRPTLQFAVLTAGLSNPSEFCDIMRGMNGRECAVVEGKPFKRENRYILVLGKNLDKLWEFAREHYEELLNAGAGEDIRKALEDFDYFQRNLYKVLEALRAVGVDPPSPSVDPVEILENYLYDDGVTIVFTGSINKAEEVYRKLRHRVGEELAGRVAVHHHLVAKSKRREVEEKIREGAVRVVLSPRTLSQGIDIGNVVRVVHLGLPEEVREFYQKEGRKGRRLEQEFTESVIIPHTRWDRELLSRGVDLFVKWVNAPLEVTLVNKDNKYSLLFYLIFKLKSGRSLSKEEAEFLEGLGLLENGELTKKGEQAWYYINFYEYAPPFGVKRVYRDESGEKYLEDVSFSDLVEKFQVGCFDYTSDGLVTGILLGGSRGRAVRRIEVSPIRESVLYAHDAIAYALEEYKKTKLQWGEKPSLYSDYMKGSVRSEAISNVIPPTGGFGMYIKLPYKVVWHVESERGSLLSLSGKTFIYRRKRTIEVPGFVAGRYSDFTYGELYELNPGDELKNIRLGAAFLSVFLRERYNMPLHTFSFSFSALGGRKTVVIWEEECAGFIEKMDWFKVYREIDDYKPSELAEIYLLLRDEEAYSEWLSFSGDWEVAKAFTKRLLEYVLQKRRIKVVFYGEEMFVPKPGRHLKLVALDTLLVPIREGGEVSKAYVGIFDGDESAVSVFTKEFYKVSGPGDELNNKLMNLVNDGFRVLIYDLDRVRGELHAAGLTYHAATLAGLLQLGAVIDVKKVVEEKTGLQLPLSTAKQLLSKDALSSLGIEKTVDLGDLELELAGFYSRLRTPGRSPKRLPSMKFLDEASRRFIDENVRVIYLLWLIFNSQAGQKALEKMMQVRE